MNTAEQKAAEKYPNSNAIYEVPIKAVIEGNRQVYVEAWNDRQPEIDKMAESYHSKLFSQTLEIIELKKEIDQLKAELEKSKKETRSWIDLM